MLELAEEGTTIVISSHNLAEIDRVTKQIIFLKAGKLMEVDMSKHEKTYYEFILSDVELATNLLKEKEYSFEHNENRLKVELTSEQLDGLIHVFQTNNIQIMDVQKEVTGSEKLYEEIFEV